MPAENSNPPPLAATVRYSLPALLAELKLERTTGSFAQEKIDQVEITKLFTTATRRRAKPKK
jgi:hypothetical protein